MSEENPDFDPKVGDSVWYDHNDDWAEATIIKKTSGGLYSVNVDGVGKFDNIKKSDLMPVEYENEEDGDQKNDDAEEVPEVEEERVSSIKVSGPARNTVSFPAGPLGIDINQVNGRIVVTSSKGNALAHGVLIGDILVRIGDVELDPHLKDVPNDKKCAEVKKIVVSFPRPLDMFFVKAEVPESPAKALEPATTTTAAKSKDTKAADAANTSQQEKEEPKKKASWSLFGSSKKEESTSPTPPPVAPAPAAAAASNTPKAPPKGASDPMKVTFNAGPLGLSVANNGKKGLCVTKASGQAEEGGILIGDEIVALNGKDCRSVKSDDFKKLIQAAGRPFVLSLLRDDDADGVEEDETPTTAAALKAKNEAEKRQIEEAKLAAKKLAAEKALAASEKSAADMSVTARIAAEKEKAAAEKAAAEQAAAEKEKKSAEAAAEVVRKREEEAREAKAAAVADKNKQSEAASSGKDEKEFAVGQEVWYDNGEDWVEATIVKKGKNFTVELRESGEEVIDVEPAWLAPMEYEDDGNNKGDDGDDDELNLLAQMAAGDSESDQEPSPVKTKGGTQAKAASTTSAKSGTSAQKSKASGVVGALKSGTIMGKASNFKGRESHMAKYLAAPVDKETALDSLHRARTAKMSYAAMVTYASFRAGATKKDEETTEDPRRSAFLQKVKKVRSKSIEKRGPQLEDGESHYQYLMRKKREEAYEQELLKNEERDELMRQREERLQQQQEYRERLREEYEEKQKQYEEEEGAE